MTNPAACSQPNKRRLSLSVAVDVTAGVPPGETPALSGGTPANAVPPPVVSTSVLVRTIRASLCATRVSTVHERSRVVARRLPLRAGCVSLYVSDVPSRAGLCVIAHALCIVAHRLCVVAHAACCIDTCCVCRCARAVCRCAHDVLRCYNAKCFVAHALCRVARTTCSIDTRCVCRRARAV